MILTFVSSGRNRAQLAGLAAWLVALLVIGSTWRGVTARSAFQTSVTVQDALRDGHIEAIAKPLGIGFRQPLVRLHLRNLISGTQQVEIPTGTRLVSGDMSFTDLIVADGIQAQINANSEAAMDIPAFSMKHQLGFPSATGVYTYVVGPIDNDPAISDLLEQIREQQVQDQFGAQLAIWSVNEGISIDELTNRLNIAPQATDISLARQLVKEPIAEATPPNETTPVPTSAVEPKQPIGFGVWMLILVGGFLLLALGVAAGLTLRERQPATPAVPADQPLAELPNALAPGAVTTVPPLILDTGDKAIGTRVEYAEARLVCRHGRLAGKAWPLPDQCLLSRGPILWKLIPEATLSSPHAVVDTTTIPYRLKDLNSRIGTKIGNETIGTGFQDLEGQQEVMLGSVVLLIAPNSLVVRRGTMAGKVFTLPEGTIVISREEIPVIVTGPDDRGISDVHVLLHRNGQVFVIRDLNSSNGTLVNRQRIVRETSLNLGDVITLGNCEFEIESNFTS